MASQTEYGDRMAVGFPGMLSDTGFFDNDSMTVIDGDLPFGAPAAYGDADRTCRPLASGDERIAGAVIRVQGGNPESGDNFVVGETASIMKKGRMHVTVATAVTAGDTAFANITAKAFDKAGAIEVGVFETGADAGGLAVMRLVAGKV